MYVCSCRSWLAYQLWCSTLLIPTSLYKVKRSAARIICWVGVERLGCCKAVSVKSLQKGKKFLTSPDVIRRNEREQRERERERELDVDQLWPVAGESRGPGGEQFLVENVEFCNNKHPSPRYISGVHQSSTLGPHGQHLPSSHLTGCTAAPTTIINFNYGRLAKGWTAVGVGG